MSSDASDCQVLISGIQGSGEDDIILFIESARHCPNGGSISHFLRISEDEAIVIFEDSQVASRLGEQLTLLNGTRISIEPYKDYERRISSRTAVNTVQVSPYDGSRSSNERSKNRPRSLEAARNGNRSSRSHQSSSRLIDNADKRSGKTQSSTHLNVKPFSPNKVEERLNRLDSGDGSRAEASDSRESSESTDRSISRSSSDGSSREPSRAEEHSHSSRTHDKHGERRRSRSSSKEPIPADRKKHGETYSGDYSERRRPRGRSGDQGQAGRQFGSRHSDRRRSGSSSSSSSSSERQVRVNWPGTSKASTGRNNKSHSDASFEHSKMSKSEKPQLPQKPQKPQTLPKPQKPPKPPTLPKPQKPSPETQKTVETLKFPREKLKLMKLVWDLDSTLSSSCNCNVTFDEVSYVIALEGTACDITTTKIVLYEISNASESQRVDVAPQILKLLSTAKGENWVREDFRKQGVPAFVYIKDTAANLIAKNNDTLIIADTVLKQFVSTQKVSFDDYHLSFLRSPSWSQKVQAIEASGLISVQTDHTAKKVEVTGRAADVDLYAIEILELLKENQTKTSTIKHKIGVVRLLQRQDSAINKDIIKDAGSSVQLEFNCREGVVKVSGLLDEVSKAENIIRDKYMKTIVYDTHEICTPGLTKEMFRERQRRQRDMIELLENRHRCVIEVRGGGRNRPRSSGSVQQKPKSPSETPSTGIEVVSGNIVQFQADVLVNTIADEGLEMGGVVLKQFLKAGAPKLKQDLVTLGIPQIFGTGVVATDACGTLKAKFIFHAAIRKYQNQDSIEKLHNMIKKCLEMAAERKASTIAFPSLGSGRLAFTPKDVVECFVRAKQTTQTTVKMIIVAFDNNTHKEFRSQLSNALLTETTESEWQFEAEGEGQSPSPSDASQNVVVFHINATSKNDLQQVKEGLIERIGDMVDEVTFKEEIITFLDDSTIADLRDLQTPEVAIDLDRRNGVIRIKGDRVKVTELKGLVSAVLLTLKEIERYPRYWTNYRVTDDTASKVGIKRAKVNPTNTWYAEVSHLVMASWDQKKVGLGRDAKGLGQHTIKIRNIYCIENPSQFDKYMAKRSQLSTEASQKKFSPVNGLRNEQEIMTMTLGLRHLYDTLDPAVNEVFLLHGTKTTMIDLIDSDGLDTRICGPETLFGVGSYCAESSTKADQYADPVGNRVALGQPLYMYVCRVLLGKPYVCDDPDNVKDFKRPPCMKKDCHKDKCSHPPVGRFDSIIGTHRPNPKIHGRLHFREFVVFHPDQSYPDFLVEYERVKHP